MPECEVRGGVKVKKIFDGTLALFESRIVSVFEQRNRKTN